MSPSAPKVVLNSDLSHSATTAFDSALHHQLKNGNSQRGSRVAADMHNLIDSVRTPWKTQEKTFYMASIGRVQAYIASPSTCVVYNHLIDLSLGSI